MPALLSCQFSGVRLFATATATRLPPRAAVAGLQETVLLESFARAAYSVRCAHLPLWQTTLTGP